MLLRKFGRVGGTKEAVLAQAEAAAAQAALSGLFIYSSTEMKQHTCRDPQAVVLYQLSTPP